MFLIFETKFKNILVYSKDSFDPLIFSFEFKYLIGDFWNKRETTAP